MKNFKAMLDRSSKVEPVHDCGCLGLPDAKIAADEFLAESGLTPTHSGDRWGDVVFIEPKTPVTRK